MNYTDEEYEMMWNKYLNDEIDEDQWDDYAYHFTIELMKRNHDVLKRLKNR